MTVVDDADAQIDEAVDEAVDAIELVRCADDADGVVVDTASTPCSAEEARALIGRAVHAANDFYLAINELLSRQAHLALGYDSPRQMLSRELAGMLVNPRTGEPVSDTHLRRMTRVAWLVWSIAQTTGLDITDLNISENQLRKVSSASAGPDDVDLIEELVDRVNEVKDQGRDAVQDVTDSVLKDYDERNNAGESENQQPPRQPGAGTVEDDTDDSDDDNWGDAGAGGPSATGNSQPPRSRESGGNGGADVEDDAGDADAGSPSPPSPPASVTTAFETALPDGFDAEVSDMEISSALVHMRRAGDLRRVMNDINRIHSLLPAIAEIKTGVPHVVDAIDDDQLAAFKHELNQCEEAVTWVEQARQTLADAITETEVRIDEAI